MLRRLSVQTAGESHGRGIFVTLTGLPAGVPLDLPAIDTFLARRQKGFGRSSRQTLEHDRVEVLAGAWQGCTSGAPLLLAVWNTDNSLDAKPAFHKPRPGHGDLAGAQKFGSTDMRPVLERASARETAGRVAAGAVAAGLLERLGIAVFAHVLEVGGVPAGNSLSNAAAPGTARRKTLAARREASPFHSLEPGQHKALEQAVLAARSAGDSLGGRVEVLAWGVPPGLGSLDDFGSRLDARLGAALLSIPGIKAVEIGEGVASAALRGSVVHDPLGPPDRHGPTRSSNRAGGIEAGMSNGQPLVARAWMKPIPTLARPLSSWDFALGEPAEAFFERSDVTSVPAAAVVAEAMVALVVADALLLKLGGDHFEELPVALAAQARRVARIFGQGAGSGRRQPIRGRRKPREPGAR